MARLHIRLNEEADKDIVAWLAEQADKSAAVKDAIRATIGGNVQEADGPAVDLCAIRAVLEAVLDERLSNLALAPGAAAAQDEDQELASKLDAMF